MSNSKEQTNHVSTTDVSETHTSHRLAGKLVVGDYVMVEDRPCRIIELQTNSNLVQLTTLNIFTGEEGGAILGPSEQCETPIVSQQDYKLSNIDRSILELLKADGSTHSVRMRAGDLYFEIREALQEGKELAVTVVSAVGEEHVVECRTAVEKEEDP